jgi:K+-transporting ATPase ATPase B chain
MKNPSKGLFDFKMMFGNITKSILMLNPTVQFRNPVMFVTYIGALATTIYTIQDALTVGISFFDLQISLWLWFTVLFANFAQTIAESRGKAHAESLKKSKIEAYANKIVNGKEIEVASYDLKRDDVIVCCAGETIPVDGEAIEGIATVDESAITGESAPVIRESGGDRSAVTAGTKILSDRLVIRVVSEPGNSFLDRMINLIEGAKRQKTPNEIALNILLSGLTIVFLLATCSLKLYADYSGRGSGQDLSYVTTLPILISLLVCLIPTTISALLSAVGISGMDRLVRRNVIAKSGRSVEAAGDIDLLILDKTGTITIGNRLASAFLPVIGVKEIDFARIAQLASLSDETPEGRSIVVLAKNKFDLRAESLDIANTKFLPFTAKTRMSGLDFLDEKGNVVRRIRKGAPDSIKKFVQNNQSPPPPVHLEEAIRMIANQGGTPLLVSDDNKIVGIVHLKDVIKGGLKERFVELRRMGIRTLMVTGDNPLTAAAIAAEAGVDDYIAEATPEIKLARIRSEQEGGRLIAMTGDGTNDAPALAQADVGVAMNTGTQASREAGNMVDLDSNPTKLIDIVEIGKQLLMTRGALTTFSIANDVAKYFAIIPAIFGGLYLEAGAVKGPLEALNLMRLHSHESAILSAVIFNALVIIALIPLALGGVRYRPATAYSLLRRNLLIYGLGGIILPFVGIKCIDIIITFFRLTQ